MTVQRMPSWVIGSPSASVISPWTTRLSQSPTMSMTVIVAFAL